MSGLPDGWQLAEFAELLAVDGVFSDGDWVESKDQDPNGAIRLLQLADIGDGNFLDKSNRFINETKFEELRCTELTENDVLIARMPDPLGRACLMPDLPQRCITVVDVAILRPGGSGVEPRWLMHSVNAPQFRAQIEANASGTTRKRISRGNLAKLSLPVPPRSEQKRIADKLDSVLARVDACRDRLDRIPALLKRFRQSVLAAATSGRLTAEWREGATNSEWELVSVGALCDAVFDGPFGSNLKSDDYVPSGVRVVRLENITHLAFDAAKETYVSEKKYESLVKHTLAPDDVLFSSFVDEEVRVCLYPEGLPTKAINKADCFVLRADNTRCLPKYLALRLACKTTYLDLKELVHGATRPRINLKQLKQYALDLPSLAEQHEIVRRVETLFAFADRLEARCAAARRQAGQLTPALLAKAFRGELVPQDPADEPAAELLKRLGARRAEAPKVRRGRKPVRTAE